MSNAIILVYDGKCPFCANYVQLLQLREAFPGIELVDARESPHHPAVRQLRQSGFRLDDGMALLDGDRVFHGADSVHALATRGSQRSLFGKVNRAIFRSQALSAALYPVLRTGRNLTLKLLGRRKLGF